jgi:hypothetical protein
MVSPFLLLIICSILSYCIYALVEDWQTKRKHRNMTNRYYYRLLSDFQQEIQDSTYRDTDRLVRPISLEPMHTVSVDMEVRAGDPNALVRVETVDTAPAKPTNHPGDIVQSLGRKKHGS